MTTPSPHDVTRLLRDWRGGDKEALEKLTPLVYIELRYFGGLDIEEIGEVMGISVATVRRHMRMAEAWLHRELSK
jgi:DNA-directed RNA polymerase specialized sigma24 family protein